MADTKRVIIGSETDDTLKLNLDELGLIDKVTLPVSIYDDSGAKVADFNIPSQYELAGNTTHTRKYYTSLGAVSDGIIWSPAAGKRWYITDIFIGVSSDCVVTLEDDLAAGDSPFWKMELAANSGWSHRYATPLFSGEDEADLIITTSGGSVYATISGYEI